MKTLGLIVGLALTGMAQGDTLRCANQLISLGDRSFEVQQKCGAPVFRDLLGYHLGASDRRESKIEEWVYGPENGMLHILTFKANRLVKIDSKRGN